MTCYLMIFLINFLKFLFAKADKSPIFALAKQMVIVAQLVRASDCGSEGRGFETRLSPQGKFC